MAYGLSNSHVTDDTFIAHIGYIWRSLKVPCVIHTHELQLASPDTKVHRPALLFTQMCVIISIILRVFQIDL